MKAEGIITAKNGGKWADLPEIEFTKDYKLSETTFVVDTKQQYQSFIGFGGAVTESSAFVINQAPEKLQEEMIKAYFTEDGLNYNLGRVHIASCDFCLDNYEYLTNENLDSFDMSHEEKYVLPLIKKIEKIKDEKIAFLASPWSPPAFMKTNGIRNTGGYLKREYFDLYAKYLIKYLQEMKKYGIIVKAITVQNEPAAVQSWDSCIYGANDERDFVRDFLGPQLQKANLDVKILVWDHNRGDILVQRAIEIFEDPIANKYIWGIGNHWYVSDDFNSLTRFHNMFPDKGIIFTEGCVEYSIFGGEPLWKNGEYYAYNMINDFNNFSQGFIDWNIVLDSQGGPNHKNNYCEAPIMYDMKNEKIKYNVSYYYLGHFSKFIKQGAKRVSTVKSSSDENLFATSFLNPDGELVLVVMNRGKEKETTIIVDGIGKTIVLPDNSIITLKMGGNKK